MLPSDSIATTAAPFATLAGAAFMALAMRLASLGFAAFLSAANTPVTTRARTRRQGRKFGGGYDSRVPLTRALLVLLVLLAIVLLLLGTTLPYLLYLVAT